MRFHFTIPRTFRHWRRQPRSLVLTIIAILALSVWVVYGGQIISSLNPMLKRQLILAERPALDVWITPPDYTHMIPMIISTPAGPRFEQGTITVAEGSTVSAHLAEQDGDAPELVVDGDGQEFTTDTHGDFAATQVLSAGKKLSIRRGWVTLASWRINVIPDNAPKIALTDTPTTTDSKNIRLSYTASDDFGITDISLRVTPRDPMPGANNAPVDISLPLNPTKQITQVTLEDLTSYPWAGQSVTMQLVATNESGKASMSDPVQFTLPERHFFHPVARILIDERKKLMQQPDDESLREETANIMAGIAHEAGSFHGDPVVMMALRSGAVRLVLARDRDAAVSVGDILWQAATRIEDGASGTAEHNLRDARQDLAKALDRGATQQEIEMLTARLETALAHYLAQLSERHAQADNGSGEPMQDMTQVIKPTRDAADQARADLSKSEKVLNKKAPQ